MKPTTRSWTCFGLSAAFVAACSAFFFLSFPDHRGVLALGLYTIPSHMFVSPFSHEPVLLYYAKSHGATLCALASTAGCLVAGMWDYWLFVPLMHHPRVRSRYIDVGLYRTSVRLFRKSPFWTLVVAGATPIPFYPVKFLSITDHYPLGKYLLALAVGRTPRYWAIAYLGHALRFPNWSLVVLALGILVFTVVQSRREAKKKRSAQAASTIASPSTATPSGAVAKSKSSGK